MTTAAPLSDRIARRAAGLLERNRRTVAESTDRLFAGLLVAEWVASLFVALVVSPLVWAGRESSLHPNVLGAFIGGGVLCSLPVYLALRRPGDPLTRHVVAAAQALFTAQLIHLTGGRIETHFLFFGALAFVSFYREWQVLVTFSVVAGVYHVAGSWLLPLSAYGVRAGAEWRWVEHVWWVVFEDAFLAVACVRWQREMRDVAERQARLETVNEGIEGDILTPLRDAARELAGSAEHLVGQVNEQRQSVVRQASALQQAHVTAQEIRQTADAASRMATSALGVADDADAQRRAGDEAISSSIDGFADIHTQVLDIAVRIRDLQQQTRQVQSITGTVKDLADQSNMLALNAAIEAARSGERGKGFGVVAREIRSLADQSIRATHDVRGVLDAIGTAVRTAADNGERGAKQIERGLEQVRASGANLRELAGAIGHMSQSVRQISATVNQQSLGIGEIFNAISQLSEVMEETQRRLEATDAAVAVVGRAAAQVREVVRVAQDYKATA